MMMITIAPSQPPHWAPSPSPSPSPTTTITTTTTTTMINQPSSPPSKLPVDFSPPLIAMVVIVATAFLIVTYSRLISRHLLPPLLRLLRRFRRWRHRRRRRLHFLPSSISDLDSPPPLDDNSSAFHALSPYGLDESSIKTIPLSIFTKNNNSNNKNTKDCAVCLLEFEENDYVRTLPVCSHAFHVDCIDIWLRSHANCPLCRAGIFITESPFIPVMAARIRPSFDDATLTNITLLETLTQISPVRSFSTVTEITPCIDESSSPQTRFSITNNNSNMNSEERFNNDGRDDFLLKRSYSFGFERNLMNERMIMEPATTSPWRHRRGSGGGGGSFWSKRPSPFGSLTKSRVFSFRHYRGGMKSPFFRRRGGGFFPLSERFVSGGGGSGGGYSRRSKSMTSPMFMRSSGVAAFSSSRLRCGDPEALLSPERFNRRYR